MFVVHQRAKVKVPLAAWRRESATSCHVHARSHFLCSVQRYLVTSSDTVPEGTGSDARIETPPWLHEASDTVRFQVWNDGVIFDASIHRQALRYCFGAGDTEAAMLAAFQHNAVRICAVACQRVQDGTRAPIMLREAHFSSP